MFSAPPVFKSGLKPRNLQFFWWLSGKKTRKNRWFLRCLGFKHGRQIAKYQGRLCRIFFFGVWRLKRARIDGIYAVLCAFPAQNCANIDGFKLCRLQSGHKLGWSKHRSSSLPYSLDSFFTVYDLRFAVWHFASWTSTRVTCDCPLPFVHPLLSQVFVCVLYVCDVLLCYLMFC